MRNFTMISMTSVLVFGLLPLANSVPAMDERAKREESMWVLHDGMITSGLLNDMAILVPASTTEHAQFLCVEDTDGVYRDQHSCSLHYRCHQGRREVYKCLDGYLFNVETSRCEEAGNVTCDVETESPRLTQSVCHEQEDMFYANHSSACQEYFRCEGQTLTSLLSCEPGLSFSFTDQACLPSSDISCVDAKCGDNGFFTLPGSSCQAYYQCEDGSRKDFLCPRGETFDHKKQTCIMNGQTCFEPLCTGRVNGRYPDTSNSCQRSFLCSGGKLTSVQGCPHSQTFDGKTCVSSSSVVCQSAESTAVAITYPDRCASLADGYHRLSDNECRRYFICRGGATIATLQCPVGLRFNGKQCAPAATTKCSLDCLNKSDGYHTDPSSVCREYTYCMGGRNVAQRSCPESTLYNGRMCVPDSMFSCPFAPQNTECSSLDNGFHTDYVSSCRNYFYCSQKQVLFRSSCTEGYVWDGASCVKQTQFMCKGPEPWAGCLSLPTGLYQDASSQCRNYYHCSSGSRTQLACRDDQLFNGKQCVSSSEYVCPSQDPNSCDNKPEGYYQDTGSSCHSYFYCSNGHKITYVCFGSHVFDGKECVDPSIYKCPYTNQDCAGLTNGYHHDTASGCRKYFYCMAGNKITTLTCGGGKVFDGRRCVDQSSYQCPGAVSICMTKADGVYADKESGCRRYYRCIQQRQESAHLCPDGKVFNGTDCVAHKGNHACSSATQNLIMSDSECGNSLNGFYHDKSSGCRRYYFCIDGIKTVLTCPSNQLFDGQVCVDANFFSCPNSVPVPYLGKNNSNKAD